jgi:UDP-N-acetylglucosamine:LPS N-acetylglucosamine transferase
MKVLLTAGGGGHTGYALALATALKPKAKLIFLIDKKDGLSRARLSPLGEVVSVTKPRQPGMPLWKFICRFIICGFQSLWIWLKHRPDVVVSTGSNIAIPICIVAKLLGSRIVNVEDSVRIFSSSKTSKYLDLISEVTLLQWKEQSEFHSKKGRYVGLLLPNVKPSTRNGKIIISPGSFGFKELYNAAVRTNLKDVMMTVGDLNPDAYSKPGWIVIDRLIGLDEVLASAKVVVTHLGYTIWEAVNYGVPAVVVPNPKWRRSSVSEVDRVAKFVQEKGYGLYLPAEELTPERLEEAVRHAQQMSPASVDRGTEKAAQIIIGEEN